ncbi:CHAT domain-containing protein [Nostoc sp. ChiSLP03a]|uniref:nSTAND1 domain-containing NTPase n=1 Tax=Nostoc sp. ChiSLP03a TaxID=3075380 RepID=UPI002AD28853|nr:MULTISPECIES: CHAT domain-containing protein [Nostocaceae]MDZ8208237.1 CHAT domain-containing protein [Dendronalium sp. ChiSLP03b]MDZ8212522.1 CHAT domain-containing protein [Nostoc sp. ChiSLP03a]
MNSDIPVKILFLAADPSDDSRRRLGQELRDIKQRLQLAKQRGNHQLEQRESVRVEDITQAIFDVNPQIVHFSGHGKSTGELCFENKVGQIQAIEPEALAAMFALFTQVNCVVLNACYSEVQAKAIAEHIPFVIGMNDTIGDAAAIAFAVGFYKALAAKRSIEEAFKFGCVEIQLQGIPEHLTPVIYVKKNLIPDGTLNLTVTENLITNPFIPQQGRVEDPQLFFGREREIGRIFEVLNSGSSVALIGEEGIGKSSVLWAICQQAETHLKRQQVFLDLNWLHDENEFYGALCYEVGISESKGYMLTRNLRDKRVLLAIDNVGKLTWSGFTRQVRDQLRGLAEGRDASLRLILAASEPLDKLFNDSQDNGKTSPLAGICQEENVKAWDETRVRAFIASRLAMTSVRFTEREIIQLIQESGGHPQKLMRLCDRTYLRYMEGV